MTLGVTKNTMEAESIYLRALEEGDLERTHKWHNDACVFELVAGVFRFVSRQAELEWLKRRISFSNTEINLAICLTSTGDHIGNIYIREIDWIARHGELTGIILGEPECRGKGYGSIALNLLLAHAFNGLGLLRVYGMARADHLASIRMMEKCGFVMEGKLRKHAFSQGEFHDLVMMGVTADEWAAVAMK